jgi:hypothetical protein
MRVRRAYAVAVSHGDAVALGVLAAHRLARLRVCEIEEGLSESELTAAEESAGVAFAADHRAFLASGLPTGEGWPDWRGGDARSLVSAPIDGVLFDVEVNGFWHPSWRARPADPTEALAVARYHLAAVPVLVPVFGHRYLPGGRGTYGHPVLSVHQTDVVCYGADLADYISREFGARPTGPVTAPVMVEFWRDLV